MTTETTPTGAAQGGTAREVIEAHLNVLESDIFGDGGFAKYGYRGSDEPLSAVLRSALALKALLDAPSECDPDELRGDKRGREAAWAALRKIGQIAGAQPPAPITTTHAVEIVQERIATLTAERDEARNNCNGSCDIALARRQIGPDGIVPGNARQCAELWEREASRERAAHAETRKIADQLKDQMQLVKAQISEACPGVVTFMYSHAIRDIARERDEAKKAHAETRKALEEARDERNAFREQMGVAERERDQALAVNSERVREIDALRAERDRLAADPRLELPYVVDVPLPTGSKAMAAFRIEAYAHEWPTAARLIGAEVVSPDAVKAAPAPARAEAVSGRAKAFREIAERVSRFQTIAADGLVSAAWVVGYCEARAEAEATKGVGGEGR